MKNLINLLKNIRPYRSIHYSGLVIGGALIGYWVIDGKGSFIESYGIETIFLTAAIVFAFQSACVINDFFDVAGDKVSNPERPLVTKSVSIKIYRNWGLICLFLSLLLSIVAGWVPFALICLFQILYTIYSIPPFRLKKYFPVNTAIVALNGLVAMVAGFSIVAGKRVVYDFPIRLAVMVIVTLITSINMIHLKDREGDIAVGIKTIPSMMSVRNAKIAIAMLTVTAYLSVPVILGISSLYIFSLIGASLGVYWVLRKKWIEGPYFMTYFVYYAAMLYFMRNKLLDRGAL